MIDFSNCEVNSFRMYGGGNGKKICIKYNNENYMIKFPSSAMKLPDMSYTNSCISEYIGCKVFKELGFKVQDVILGTFNNKIVVACKDFEKNGFSLKEFSFLKNTIISSSHNGYGTELVDILSTIKEQKIVDTKILLKFFWRMFIVDALLGNFDRHNGNWGFLINEDLRIKQIAPIYDCGSCLYPKINEDLMKKVITDSEELEKRIYIFPNSAIKLENQKINYFNFLSTYNDRTMYLELKNILKCINIDKINKIIDDIPCITNLHKNFLKLVISERKEKILEYSLIKNLEINKNFYKNNREI